MTETKIQQGSNWRKDIPASLVVFLVALPLSIGIAIASGAPVRAGIVGAIAGGIVVGLTGGSPLQISGPAAGLTVMVFAMVQKFGFETMGVITIGAGVLQLIGGLKGVARAALAISPAVLHAMLAAIGVMIALGQLHVVLGSKPYSNPIDNIKHLPDSFAQMNPHALIVGLMSLGLIILWNNTLAKKIKAIPGSLVAIVVGTLAATFFLTQAKKVDVSGAGLWPVPFPQIPLNKISDVTLFKELLTSMLALAIVASAESLLCAVATDKLHSGERGDLNKELRGQGIGNIVSGLLGGLPITGVIVRSSANISAGGISKWSAILHGVWMLVFVVLLGSILGYVPLAALAGLLIHVGYNLVKVKEFMHLKGYGEHWVYLTTFFGILLTDLLKGIMFGLGLAIAMLLYRLARVDIQIYEEDERTRVVFKGNLNFLTVPSISARLAEIPVGKNVFVDFEADQLDHAAIEAIEAWKQGYARTGGTVEVESLDAMYHSLKLQK